MSSHVPFIKYDGAVCALDVEPRCVQRSVCCYLSAAMIMVLGIRFNNEKEMVRNEINGQFPESS